MSRNIRKHKLLTSLVFAVGVLLATSSNAHWRGHDWRGGWHARYWHSGWYHPHVFRGPVLYRGGCKWVGGYWHRGHWRAAQRVCW